MHLGYVLHDQKSNAVLFQTVFELQNLHLVFGYLFVQNYFSAHTTSACATQDLNFCLFLLRRFSVGCSFFYSIVFTPALPDCRFTLTTAPSLWDTLVLFINTTSLQHAFIFLFLVLTMSTMAQKFATEQNSSKKSLFSGRC